MQPLTADSGPFDLPPSATPGLKTAFVQNSQFANILPSQGEIAAARIRTQPRGFRKIFLQLLTRERILFSRNFTKKLDSFGSFLPFGFMKN